jgi:hypothetical protein
LRSSKGSVEDTCGTPLTEGYKIPFYETPPRASFENNGSTRAHKDFVTKSIQELLVTGSLKRIILANSLTMTIGRLQMILSSS